MPAFPVHDPVKTYQYRPVSAWMAIIAFGDSHPQLSALNRPERAL
ncbi:MAG: hypothetical protein ACHQIM_10950 [Sphingobacteriales bacterium]